MRVRVVLWKWFMHALISLVLHILRICFYGSLSDSFIYLGGMHGYNVSNPGVWMILLITAICFFIYISARTVSKLFALSFLKREKKEKEEVIPEGGDQEFTTSQPRSI